MKPTLTSVLVLVVLSALFTVLPERGVTATTVGISVFAALILVLGAWLAPASGGKPFAMSGGPAWQAAKNLQLVLGGLVAAGAIAWFTDNPGIAALVGIVGAMFFGFVAPSGSNHGREGTE